MSPTYEGEVIRPRIKLGESIVEHICCDEYSTEEFLTISKDANKRLHSKDGLRVVQGVFILVLLNEVASRHTQGFGFAGTEEPLKIKKTTRIGETLAIRITCLEERKSRIRLQIIAEKEGVEIFRNVVVLVPERLLERS